MRFGGFFTASVLFFALVAIAGKAQDAAKRPEKESPYAELGKAPEKYRLKQNPMTKDAEAPLAGRVLFEEHCAECHGQNAMGTKKAPSLRTPEVQNAADGTIFWILSNGIVRKGMPVWSKLPEPQRWQLVSYLKTLGSTPPPDQSASRP